MSRRERSSSLVLLDELGKGTEVVAGSALAAAVVEDLVAAGAAGVFATHLHDLVYLLRPLEQQRRLQFWAMEVRPEPCAGGAGGAGGAGVEVLRPTRRVVEGQVCLRSLALQVAADCGLQREVLAAAAAHEVVLGGMMTAARAAAYSAQHHPQQLQPLQPTHGASAGAAVGAAGEAAVGAAAAQSCWPPVRRVGEPGTPVEAALQEEAAEWAEAPLVVRHSGSSSAASSSQGQQGQGQQEQEEPSAPAWPAAEETWPATEAGAAGAAAAVGAAAEAAPAAVPAGPEAGTTGRGAVSPQVCPVRPGGGGQVVEGAEGSRRRTCTGRATARPARYPALPATPSRLSFAPLTGLPPSPLALHALCALSFGLP